MVQAASAAPGTGGRADFFSFEAKESAVPERSDHTPGYFSLFGEQLNMRLPDRIDEDPKEAELQAVPDCRWQFAQMAKAAAVGESKGEDGFVPQKIDLGALFGQSQEGAGVVPIAHGGGQASWALGDADKASLHSHQAYYNPWASVFANSGDHYQHSTGSVFGEQPYGSSWGLGDAAN